MCKKRDNHSQTEMGREVELKLEVDVEKAIGKQRVRVEGYSVSNRKQEHDAVQGERKKI